MLQLPFHELNRWRGGSQNNLLLRLQMKLEWILLVDRVVIIVVVVEDCSLTSNRVAE